MPRSRSTSNGSPCTASPGTPWPRAARISATSTTGAASAESKSPSRSRGPILERYQRWLYHYRKTNGQPLGFRTQHTRLQAMKGFFQWMARHNHLLHNPASEIVLPRMEHRLPKYVLNGRGGRADHPAARRYQPEGLRDRAILETFYSTGMRRMELANLKVYDLDAERGTLTIRQGKGRKDRVIPIGERALAWIAKYLATRARDCSPAAATTARCSSTHWASRSTAASSPTLVRAVSDRVGGSARWAAAICSATR